MKVSIILPVYNSQSTLSLSINSVLQQTYKDFELLIIDDGSTDGSLEVIKKYSYEDPRIKWISRENRGLAKTLNELIDLASSEYIFRMDSDDICYPNRLYDQVQFMDDNPDVVMLGGQIDFLVDQNVVPTFFMPLEHVDILDGLRQARFPICHPAIVFRRSVALRVGMYGINLPGEDLDFFLRMSEVGKLGNVPSKILCYRIGLNSLSIRGVDRLSFAYSLACLNYERRRKGIGELSASEYEDLWSMRFIERLKYNVRSISEMYYRKSIIIRSSGGRHFIFFLLLAAVLRPRAVFDRINLILKRKFND